MDIFRHRPLTAVALALSLIVIGRVLLEQVGMASRGIDALSGAVILILASVWLASTADRSVVTVVPNVLLVLTGLGLLTGLTILALIGTVGLLVGLVTLMIIAAPTLSKRGGDASTSDADTVARP